MIPGREPEVPHVTWPKKLKHKIETILLTNSINTLKMIHIRKKSLTKESRSKNVYVTVCLYV